MSATSRTSPREGRWFVRGLLDDESTEGGPIVGGPVDRRTLLRLVGGSAVGLVAFGCTSSTEAADLCEAADASASVPVGVVRIGERYAELFPDDDGDDVAAIVAGAGDGSGGADALVALVERVRDDFAAGDVVQVDGWYLARTEARAARLLAAC